VEPEGRMAGDAESAMGKGRRFVPNAKTGVDRL